MSGRVLIVDDVATNRIVMRFKLASAFYDTLQAANGAEALGELARQSASVVVVPMPCPICRAPIFAKSCAQARTAGMCRY